MEKREEIILLASKVFMECGIKSVSMDDLARRFGVSKKTIYAHFKDKNELIESILEEHLSIEENECTQIQNESINAVEALLTIFSKVGRNLGSIHPSVFYDLQKYHPKAWQRVEAHSNVFVQGTIFANLERGRKEGLYRFDFDSNLISVLFVQVMDSIVKREIKSEEPMEIGQVFQEVIDFLIQGLLSDMGREYIQLKNNK
jgi:AcrR family transcriptional regulator